MAPTLNLLISTFPGLNLPPSLCLPVSSNRSISSICSTLNGYLPLAVDHINLTLSTIGGRRINPTSTARISTLLAAHEQDGASFLSLRLAVPLCGGKGGFGSQLRAAGGRMSSRKKRQQGEAVSSNRNLDGRRIRTVNEAKALAEYLAVKPEMERKEKEERRKRWEAVVEASERREEEIREGKGKGRVDGKWVEEKEEVEERTRLAIQKAMREGLLREDGKLMVIEEKEDVSASDDEEMEAEGSDEPGPSSSKGSTPPTDKEVGKAISQSAKKQAPRKVFGWDEDDEGVSSSDDGKS